jgi:DinB family protein
MSDTTLAEALELFARHTHALPDADLDLPWAWQAYDEGLRYAFFRTYEELRELAAATAAERAALGPATTLAQRALAQYHAAYRDLQALLIGLPDADLDRAPAEGEWPLRKVLEHIVEADGGFYGVIRYALERQRSRGERPAEIPKAFWETVFGPEEEAAFKSAMAGTLAEIYAYYAAFHERVLREFAPISDAEIEAPARYWEGYSLPIRFRLIRFDSHLRQHTIQAEKTLDMLGRRPSEAMRLLRLAYAALAEAEGAALGAPDAGAERRRATAAAIGKRAEDVAHVIAQYSV